jgi:hypothetical protein
MGSLEGNEGFGRADYFLVGKDFPSYIECQEEVDEAYQDQKVSSMCKYLCSLLKKSVQPKFTEEVHYSIFNLQCPFECVFASIYKILRIFQHVKSLCGSSIKHIQLKQLKLPAIPKT